MMENNTQKLNKGSRVGEWVLEKGDDSTKIDFGDSKRTDILIINYKFEPLK